MTAEDLKKQGSCCGNKCKNCPYVPRHQKGSILVADRVLHFNDYYYDNLEEALEFDSAGQRILDDGKKIADYEIDEMPNVTKEEVASYFSDDGVTSNDPAVRYIKSLKLPKTFMYVWIQFIKVLPQQRGQGRGSEIINTLAMNYPPGTLMALSAEEISTGKTASSLSDLKRFYQQNGFTMVRSQGKTFGFRVT